VELDDLANQITKLPCLDLPELLIFVSNIRGLISFEAEIFRGWKGVSVYVVLEPGYVVSLVCVDLAAFAG
jgi:hypothetical protein